MSEASEAESWNSYWGRPSVRMFSMVDGCMNYDMFDQGDIQVEAEQLTDDAFYEWLCQGEEKESFRVRMVHSSVDHEEWVVLDSGADLSCLPGRKPVTI